MAANKKPRKKYSPKRSMLTGTNLPPHILAAYATSPDNMETDEIEDIISPTPVFIHNIRAGTLTEQQFWEFIENSYLYIRLLEVMTEQKQLSSNPATDIMAKLEIRQFLDEALENTAGITETISHRYKQRGRFIATGEELKHYDQLLARMRALFATVNRAHYFEAYKRAEAVLETEVYRANKAKRAKQAA